VLISAGTNFRDLNGAHGSIVGPSLRRQDGTEFWPVLLQSTALELQPRCPHELPKYFISEADYFCDECGKALIVGQVVYGCRHCDYDQCAECNLTHANIGFRKKKNPDVLLEAGHLALATNQVIDALLEARADVNMGSHVQGESFTVSFT